ncbi:hypothetical protein [Massilia pseudoviolaceinigra]|uniref:hypothetical protein n=1 Tax=Massilia pseudoviolaceinigra TaxID=3057165 RepID=UPI00279640A7|nr:hypothetical protein [Massilia sp. CCM 9206]MDQ1924711.1 hypothetical protein [Massilia sp. CCM 9206]
MQSGTSTLVQDDLDGTAGPDIAYMLMTLQNVVAANLTADNLIYAKVAAHAALVPVELVGVPPDYMHAP